MRPFGRRLGCSGVDASVRAYTQPFLANVSDGCIWYDKWSSYFRRRSAVKATLWTSMLLVGFFASSRPSGCQRCLFNTVNFKICRKQIRCGVSSPVVQDNAKRTKFSFFSLHKHKAFCDQFNAMTSSIDKCGEYLDVRSALLYKIL